MPGAQSSISIEDLVGSKIVTSEGKEIGRVVDVQVSPGPKYKVVALVFGRYGWLYRFHVLQPFVKTFGLRHEPRTVPWDAVKCFEHFTVTLKPGRS
jgi:sporulation protein YlmC with PRC-barrel domain